MDAEGMLYGPDIADQRSFSFYSRLNHNESFKRVFLETAFLKSVSIFKVGDFQNFWTKGTNFFVLLFQLESGPSYRAYRTTIYFCSAPVYRLQAVIFAKKIIFQFNSSVKSHDVFEGTIGTGQVRAKFGEVTEREKTPDRKKKDITTSRIAGYCAMRDVT